MTRRRWLQVVAALLASAAIPVLSAQAAAPAPERAQAFIAALADKAVAALTDPKVPEAERERRFRQLLNEHFAVSDIGQWVLARHWAQATPAERVEYQRLFEELIVHTYVTRFSRYQGETLKVIGATVDGDDTIVSSQIVRPSGDRATTVEWRVHAYPAGLKITDAVVEGVSQRQTQRSEFGSVMRRGGGSVAGLLDEMRRMVKRPQ